MKGKPIMKFKKINGKSNVIGQNIRKYRELRQNERTYRAFIQAIEALSPIEFTQNTPIKLSLGDETLHFTQTHLAEIWVLLKLMKEEIVAE